MTRPRAVATYRVLTATPWQARLIARGHLPTVSRDTTTDWRGPVLVHAGRAQPRLLPRDCQVLFSFQPEDLPRDRALWQMTTAQHSAVVATAELVDVCTGQDCDCVGGVRDTWHWKLVDVRPLHIAAVPEGRHGLWRLQMTGLDREAVEAIRGT